MINSSAGGLVPNRTAGLYDFREDVAMAMTSGEADYREGAQPPRVHPQQKGHQEMGGQTNTESTGRNGSYVGTTHDVSGTALPSGTGAGKGTVRKGGRAVR